MICHNPGGVQNTSRLTCSSTKGKIAPAMPAGRNCVTATRIISSAIPGSSRLVRASIWLTMRAAQRRAVREPQRDILRGRICRLWEPVGLHRPSQQRERTVC